jgi:hypothetical protein
MVAGCTANQPISTNIPGKSTSTNTPINQITQKPDLDKPTENNQSPIELQTLSTGMPTIMPVTTNEFTENMAFTSSKDQDQPHSSAYIFDFQNEKAYKIADNIVPVGWLRNN